MKMNKKGMMSAAKSLGMAVLAAGVLANPVLAQATFAGEEGAACGFFNNIGNILNIVSIAVVTIAIIFAGYQIAFAHKRISDVAPILIGGLLIGAAGQIATMIMPNQDDACKGDLTTMVVYEVQQANA